MIFLFLIFFVLYVCCIDYAKARMAKKEERNGNATGMGARVGGCEAAAGVLWQPDRKIQIYATRFASVNDGFYHICAFGYYFGAQQPRNHQRHPPLPMVEPNNKTNAGDEGKKQC